MPVFSKLTLTIFAILALLLGASYFLPVLLPIAALSIVGLLGASLLDYFISPNASSLEIKRQIPNKLSLGDDNEIRLEIKNRRMQKASGMLSDNIPEDFQKRHAQFSFRLKPGATSKFHYSVNPHKRGAYNFDSVSLKVNGLLGLVSRIHHVPLLDEVKVYPSYLQLKKFQLQSRRSNIQMIGRKKQRRYGEGREFESLREYTPDDEYRKVNWKATARAGKPIVSQFQIERNQNIIIVLDAGRMMRTLAGKMSKLDYAVNAALMLAYICVYKEDNVGLMVFNKKVRHYLPPKRGKAQLNLINEILYNVKFEFEEPNYRDAFQYIKRKVSRRSLVLLITDIIDELSSEMLIREFTALYPKHLPLAVTLKDQNLEKLALQVPKSHKDMLEMGIAQNLMDERLKALRNLQMKGVLTLDTDPGYLNINAVNKYLDIKSKSLI